MNRHTHRAASATIALLATILLVAPVWAAKPAGAGDGSNGNSGGNGGGNQGSVSVVDAVSGLESLTNNEPHVCTFLLAFDGAPSGESGDWSIVDWPPTGTGAEVADGGYAIPAGGMYLTGTFELDAGHYRVQWQAINAQGEKHKTFWVDDDCFAEEPEDQPEDQEQPADEPADEPTDEPEDQEQPADEPADEPTDEPEEGPGEGEVENSVEEPPAPGEPADEPAADEEPVDEPVVQGDLAPGTGGDPVVGELPDTAMPALPLPALPGLGVAVGILFLVVTQRTLRERGVRARR